MSGTTAPPKWYYRSWNKRYYRPLSGTTAYKRYYRSHAALPPTGGTIAPKRYYRPRSGTTALPVRSRGPLALYPSPLTPSWLRL